MVLLLAFSIEDQVEKYGAYVGIAAFFGLAVLSLLYFAQAREVKRLREWAGRAPERAREVEERAIAQAEAARRTPEPVAQPVSKGLPVAAATAAGGRSGTVGPAVPVGGAATAVAERPDEGEEPEEEPTVYGPVTEDGRKPVLAIEPEEDEDEEAPDEPDADEEPRGETDEDDAVEDEDEEAPAAAATNGAPPPGAQPPAIPRPSTAAGVAGATSAQGGAPPSAAGGAPVGEDAPAAPGDAAPAGGTPRPAAAPLRQTTPSASPRRPVTMPPRRPGPPPPPVQAEGGHRGRTLAIAGGVAAVVVALAVLAATQLLGGDEEQPPPNQAATPTPAATDDGGGSSGGGGNSGGGSSSSTSRGDTTVAVFNGTTVNGLAASTADKLQSSGYKRGTTGDYTDQARAASTIFYAKDARRQARDIGRELNISELRAMDAETQALAGENADIAIVVGSDKAP